MLDSITWRDPGVIALLSETAIPLKIDAEKQAKLAKRYQVAAYPTLLLIKPDGSVLDRLVGYRNAATFIAEVNDAFADKTALVRAQESVENAGRDNPKDRVQARHKLAKTLAREGKQAEALKEYLWLFDDGMKREPAFVGVRVSFLLSSIVELGQQYPPAMKALHERRDAAENQLNSGAADAGVTMDFANLNRVLKEENRTPATFDKLPATDPRRGLLG